MSGNDEEQASDKLLTAVLICSFQPSAPLAPVTSLVGIRLHIKSSLRSRKSLCTASIPYSGVLQELPAAFKVKPVKLPVKALKIKKDPHFGQTQLFLRARDTF